MANTVFASTAVAAFALISAASCGARTDLDVATNAEAGLDAGDAGDDASVPCIPGTFALKKAEPTVMFVLDASGSMAQEFAADGSTRWEVLTSSLQTALPSVDTSMQIGGLIFPTGHSGHSCSVPTTADLAPAIGNVTPLISLMSSTDPLGGTPTADAISTAANDLRGFRAASSARAIVLATDGGPNCNASLDKNTCACADPAQTQCGAEPELCLDDARTVQRIQDDASSGLPTYVIGIHDPGDTQNDQVLNAMADAGGRARSGGEHYYPATSATDMEDALVSIRDQLGSCTYLTSSVPSASGTITVTIGGVVVPYDPTGQHGWKWADESNGEIVFAGITCTDVASPDAGLIEADVSCSPPEAGVDSGADAGKKSDAGVDAGILDAGPDGS